MCPTSVEAHLRLNHARLQSYALLRAEILMLLETNIGASLKAPEAAVGGDDPMDTSAMYPAGGKGKGKGDKGNK
eukprot:5744947-Amphidinium_carterae.1